MRREISAGIIIFRKTPQGPRFLLLYNGGLYWNFPKGKIESEEKSLEAAIREVREETGLSRQDLRFIGHFREYEKFIFTKNREKIFKIVILYLAETRKSFARLSYEHEGYGWFTIKEAKSILTHYPDNFNILKKAYDFLLKEGMVRG